MDFFTKMNGFHTYFKHPYCDELTKENLEIILDFLGIFTYSKLKSINIDYPSMRAPLSVFIAKSSDNILGIGLTDDKTTFANSQISVLIDAGYSVDELEDEIVETARLEFGLEIKWYTTLDVSSILGKETFLSKFGDVDNRIERFDKFKKDQDYLSFLIELDKSSQILVNNIKKAKEDIMDINPIFKARGLTVDDKMVFCVLPFDEERLEIFNEIIKPELEKMELRIIRADSVFSNNEVMEDIWTYINKSRFVIADLSGANANVYYELGICHTVGKDVIPICDEVSLKEDYDGKLPFDINTRRTIFYKNTGAGMLTFTEKLKKTVTSIITGETVID